MGKPQVCVIVRYGLDPAGWRVRHARGEVVDETPYAYHLAQRDFDLVWSADAPEGQLARRLRLLLKRALGFDLVHVWRNRRIIAESDVVWTHTEREHLAVAALALLHPRRYRAHIVAQTVWLWDRWDGMSPLRRAVYARLLRRHDLELVLSRANRDVSLARIPDRRVLRVPFGTHFAVAGAGGGERPRVLVVGNDRHRDWALMRRVAARLPELDIDVVSLSEQVHRMPWPANTTVHAVGQTDVLAGCYARADAVALPLHANLHASGCTVAIEALSAGVPVVASDTGGIDDYLEGSGAELVALGDDDAFAAALTRAVARERTDPALAQRRGLGAADYVARLCAVTTALLRGTAVDARVLAYAPPPTAVAEGAGR